MKLIIFFILFSTSVFGNTNFIKKSKVSVCGPKKYFVKKKTCGNDCVAINTNTYNCKFSILKNEEINDLKKPIKVCEGLDAILEFVGIDENGCKITGYEKKLSGREIVAEDSVKKQNFLDTATLQRDFKSKVASQMRLMEVGREIYAKIILKNREKGLRKKQRKKLRRDTIEIRDDFFEGELCDARDGVEELVVDPIVIRQEDVDMVLGLIDKEVTCP